jgi:hypothetical protein
MKVLADLARLFQKPYPWPVIASYYGYAEKSKHLILISFYSPPSLFSAMCLVILRGSISLVVFLSMYQATPVAHYFGSQSYIIAIVSTLSLAMEPRARFLRNLFINLFFYCLAAGITCLGLWSARQAKLHTQSLSNSNSYNSSAAAVSAIFLFLNLFAINAFRAVCRILSELMRSGGPT